jgi:hypothetical protein
VPLVQMLGPSWGAPRLPGVTKGDFDLLQIRVNAIKKEMAGRVSDGHCLKQ